MFLGEAAASRGNVDEADGQFNEALALYRDMGDMLMASVCLHHQGILAFARGAYANAAALLQENLKLARGSRDTVVIDYALVGLACVAAARGQYMRATRLWGAAEAVAVDRGIELMRYIRVSTNYDDRMADARTGLGASAFADAWAQGRALSLEQALAYALEEPVSP